MTVGVDAPPTVILSISTQGQAIVDGQPCPTYTDLLVNPPDTTAAYPVSVHGSAPPARVNTSVTARWPTAR
ncbi:hypothetical protein MAHJHV63_49240 [Mycobacterium avium subsp. hominissuis]